MTKSKHEAVLYKNKTNNEMLAVREEIDKTSLQQHAFPGSATNYNSSWITWQKPMMALVMQRKEQRDKKLTCYLSKGVFGLITTQLMMAKKI